VLASTSPLKHPRNPVPTVDVIVEVTGGIVLIQRRFPPLGWALPGGFVDYGEAVEVAAMREAREETGLVVRLRELFGVYSDPRRDPRRHTLSVVFIAAAEGSPVAGDDAGAAGVFSEDTVPASLAFDHAQVLREYFEYKRTGRRPLHVP
jgi:8-oxo-dGTP diphosphatase